MENRIDFLQCLEDDMSANVLMCLEDPADLARASSVSRFWHHLVIANGLCKRLCVRMFPELSRIGHKEVSDFRKIKSMDFRRNCMDADMLERDHRVYASLLQALTRLKLSPSNCVIDAISASSTDNYPLENVAFTLDPRNRFWNRALYWSSKGHHKSDMAETLIYRLKENFCIVTEILIKPFEAFFQHEYPIYSAKSVRFRMGHPKSQAENFIHVPTPVVPPVDDKFVWTYTSEEFPMSQEYRLQTFKLAEPVLCIGGFVQIELLGGVQRQQTDALFYICVDHVQVLGRPLNPAFNIEILEPSGKFALKHNPEALSRTMEGCNGESLERPWNLPPEDMLHLIMADNNHIIADMVDLEDDNFADELAD